MTNDENKERFLDIYKTLITRDGAEDLLNFLVQNSAISSKHQHPQGFTEVMSEAY